MGDIGMRRGLYAATEVGEATIVTIGGMSITADADGSGSSAL